MNAEQIVTQAVSRVRDRIGGGWEYMSIPCRAAVVFREIVTTAAYARPDMTVSEVVQFINTVEERVS